MAERQAAFATLLEGPAAAVLTTYRKDGTAVGSPVWFRVDGDTVEVVVAVDDMKRQHLGRDPRGSLLIFEAVPPFRGVRLDGEPSVTVGDVTPTRLAISSKYLGPHQGRRFTERAGPGVVVSWPLTGARWWDLAAALP